MFFSIPSLIVAAYMAFWGIYSLKASIPKFILGMSADKLEKYDIIKFRLFTSIFCFLFAGLMLLLAFGLYRNNNVITVIVIVVAVALVPCSFLIINRSRLLKKNDI